MLRPARAAAASGPGPGPSATASAPSSCWAQLPDEVLAQALAASVAALREDGRPVSSPREAVWCSLVCKGWQAAFSPSGSLWKALLLSRWPSHAGEVDGGSSTHRSLTRPSENGASGSHSGGPWAWRLRYAQASLGMSLVLRPPTNVEVPSCVLTSWRGSSSGRAARVILNSLALRSGCLLGLQGGRLHLATATAAGDWRSQVLQDARTDRLVGTAVSHWPSAPCQPGSKLGTLVVDTLLVTVSNPWPARQSSVVEVWSTDTLSREGSGTHEGPEGHPERAARRIASFQQEDSVTAVALQCCHHIPGVALLAYCVRRARGCQLCLRLVHSSPLPGGQQPTHLNVSVAGSNISTLGWSNDPDGRRWALVAGTRTGQLLQWNVSEPSGPGHGQMGKVQGPFQVAMPVRPRSVWAIRSHHDSAGAAVIADDHKGGAVFVRPGRLMDGAKRQSEWHPLAKVEGTGRPMDACWVGESVVVIYSDGSIHLFHSLTGSHLGVVFKAKRRYLDRAQVTAVVGCGGQPPALLSLFHQGPQLDVILHTPAAPASSLAPHLCSTCSLATEEVKVPAGTISGGGEAWCSELLAAREVWRYECREGHSEDSVGVVRKGIKLDVEAGALL